MYSRVRHTWRTYSPQLFFLVFLTALFFNSPTPLFAIEAKIHNAWNGGVYIHDGDIVTPEDITSYHSVWAFQISWPTTVRFPDGLIGVYQGTFGNVDRSFSGSGFKGWPEGDDVYVNNQFASLRDMPFGTYTVFFGQPDPRFFNDMDTWFVSGGAQGHAPLFYDTITFTYAPTRTEECCSNVLFLPGVSGSDLFDRATGERLWPPQVFQGNYDSTLLRMDEDGFSVHDLYTKEVIASVANIHFYTNFFETLDSLKADRTINDWHAQPYDWREDLERVARGVIKTEEGGTTLVKEVEALAKHSRTGKVTIVAHSMGGLIGKLLIDELEWRGKKNLIDDFIMVGVPERGTPSAIGSLLHGHDHKILSGFVLSEKFARSAMSNMNSAYTLLPSEEYYTHVSDPTIFISPHIPAVASWQNAYGTTIHSLTSQTAFLADTAHTRDSAPFADVAHPEVLNKSRIDRAEGIHAVLDTWIPPSSVAVTRIVGWGVPTLKTIAYDGWETPGQGPIFKYTPLLTDEGDGTVVYVSAEGVGDVWYLNIKNYNQVNESNNDHSSIMNTSSIIDAVRLLVTNQQDISDKFIKKTKPTTNNNQTSLLIGVHSPISIGATDSAGHFTGKIFYDNSDFVFVEEQIPNSSYIESGDAKYVLLPNGKEYSLELKGTGKGVFALSIDTFNGSETVPHTVYQNIPVTPQTQGTLTINTEGEMTSFLVDTDGDGVFEKDVLKEYEPPLERTPDEILDEIERLIPSLPLWRYWKGVFYHKIIFIRRYVRIEKPYIGAAVARGTIRILDKRRLGEWASPEVEELRILYKELYELLRYKVK